MKTYGESYTIISVRHRVYYGYAYITESGELFTTTATSLDKCRERRDLWLNSIGEYEILSLGEISVRSKRKMWIEGVAAMMRLASARLAEGLPARLSFLQAVNNRLGNTL